MNDFELSKRLASAVFKDTEWTVGERNGNVIIYNSHITRNFSYRNWNDLMPLVIKFKISIRCPMSMGDRCLWSAKSFNGHRVSDEDPQRALAECLLKVLETVK